MGAIPTESRPSPRLQGTPPQRSTRPRQLGTHTTGHKALGQDSPNYPGPDNPQDGTPAGRPDRASRVEQEEEEEVSCVEVDF